MNLNYDNETETQGFQSHRLFAQNIVKAKCKKIFSSDRALSCLVKSDNFFKELLNIFCRLEYFEITPEKFQTVFANTNFAKADLKRLELFLEVYKSYISLSKNNNFSIPAYTPLEIRSFQADFAKNISDKKYLEFSDIQNESVFIISKIKQAVESGSASYADFAVFADKSESRQKFLDLMKAEKISVTGSIYNENYENLKHKINIYHKISEILLALKLEDFSLQNIKSYSFALLNVAKSQAEICFSELDEIFKNLFTEILSDTYSLDGILTKNENSGKCLLEIIYSHLANFPETDRDILNSELGLIKNFYNAYKNYEYEKAISCIIKRFLTLFENTDIYRDVSGKMKSLADLQKLYTTIGEEPDFESFKEIMQWLPEDKTQGKNSVYLDSASSDLKKDKMFKHVFVCGLTENNFPGSNNAYPFISYQTDEKLCEELRKINPDFDYFLKTDDIHFSKQYSALCNICSHTISDITFSTHSYEAKKTVMPSVFFKVLVQNDFKNYKKIEDIETDEKIFDIEKNQKILGQKNLNIVKENDVLKLNPSAISTFQQCPRKYYYKNLLNLKEPSTFSASYGSIVHAVFEVLNRKFLHSYNKNTALALAEVLFDAENNEQKALDTGFSKIDTELVKASDELSLKEMKNNFQNAIDDFDMSGYFDNPPKKAECEKSFTFSVPELPNVVFDGRIDAILTYNDGKSAVVDYKTGKDKINSLDYAISEYGVNFKSKTGKDPSNILTLQNNYDYQIPIYYLACQNSEDLKEYKDKISHLGLVYIRPQSKSDGCGDDFVSAEKIEFYKEKILQNLKETVIDKIVNAAEFACARNWNCENCGFKYLCDNTGENEDD